MNILRTLGLIFVLFATIEPASAIESLGYQTELDPPFDPPLRRAPIGVGKGARWF